MDNVITWLPVMAGGGSVLAIIAFWMGIGSRITRAEIKADAAEVLAASGRVAHETVVRDLNEYRVSSETKIAVVKTLAEANTVNLITTENRFIKAIEEIRDSLDRFNTRVDHFFEIKSMEK